MKSMASKTNKANKEIRAMEVAHNALSGLEPAEQARVLAWLHQILQVTPAPGMPPLQGAPSGTGTTQQNPPALAGNAGTPSHARGFMTQKKPGDLQERVACLAYYLANFMNMPAFKTRDITKMNSDAGQPNLSNAAVFVKNSVRAQFLSSAGKGLRQITPRGEALVNALPNRETVAQALAEHPLSGRRKKRKGKKKTTKAGS
jgi:hypothetical protein